jgi:hypothetical protein
LKSRPQQLSGNIFKGKENVSASDLTNCVTVQNVLMALDFGRDAETSRGDIMATYATVRNLTSRVVCVGQKVCVESFLPLPTLFNDLETRKINACRSA